MEAIQTAAEFAQATWGQVELGDKRLTRRAVQIGTCMAANPEASLPCQMKDPGALEGAYRFMNNQHVQMQALLTAAYQHTRQAAGKHPVVLLVNDQTELDYSSHRATTGLGPVGNERGRGILLHTTLAVDPETRGVIGLSYLHSYLRVPVPRRPRPKWAHTAEGRCWETAARAIGTAEPGSIWVEVSDAGSDYFSYLAACLDMGNQFLVRVSRERYVDWAESDWQFEQVEAQKLIRYARSLPAVVSSEEQVEIAANQDQAARTAQVVMSWAPVTLSPSAQASKQARKHPPIQAWVLRIWEPDPPAGVSELEWILLSSLAITQVEEARTRVRWYSCRWTCEDFHQCLKTGCQVERSQLDDRADLETLIGFLAPIAVHLLQIRHAVRQTPSVLAQDVVDPLMVQVLAQRQKLDMHMMSLETFWKGVARLGGFQGRKHDGFPGWRILWRGWHYLSDLTDGARLFLDIRT